MRDNAPPYQNGTTQAITTSGTSAAITNAWGANTRLIRIATTADAHYTIGSAPTATTSDPLLPAGVVEYLIVPPSLKLAAIQVTAAATFTVTEVSK